MSKGSTRRPAAIDPVRECAPATPSTEQDPHPYYGPCDGFGPGRSCSECAKARFATEAEWGAWLSGATPSTGRERETELEPLRSHYRMALEDVPGKAAHRAIAAYVDALEAAPATPSTGRERETGEFVATPFRKGDEVSFEERGFVRFGKVGAIVANNYHTDYLHASYEVWVDGRSNARHLGARDLTLVRAATLTPSPTPDAAATALREAAKRVVAMVRERQRVGDDPWWSDGQRAVWSEFTAALGAEPPHLVELDLCPHCGSDSSICGGKLCR